jgi:hypothetical protein
LRRAAGWTLLAIAAAAALAAAFGPANPWWGAAPSTVAGAIVLNTLTLGALAPALGFVLAARAVARPRRGVDRTRLRLVWALRAGAVGFALLWVALVTRHALHGPAMIGAPIGWADAALWSAGAAAVIAGAMRAGWIRPPRLTRRVVAARVKARGSASP